MGQEGARAVFAAKIFAAARQRFILRQVALTLRIQNHVFARVQVLGAGVLGRGQQSPDDAVKKTGEDQKEKRP